MDEALKKPGKRRVRKADGIVRLCQIISKRDKWLLTTGLPGVGSGRSG